MEQHIVKKRRCRKIESIRSPLSPPKEKRPRGPLKVVIAELFFELLIHF